MHIFDGSWNSETTSGYNWNYLFQGGRLELTGLYIFQHRDYDPTTGRWIEQDPAGYVDGSSLYQFGWAWRNYLDALANCGGCNS